MKTLAVNPYLPAWEFVPDGEPHVFDGRVYVYGSHDRRGGTSFCQEDYVVWSAPTDDLGNWRFEGVSYRKMQDPLNGAPYKGVLPQIACPMGTQDQPRLLFAPDVAKGPDGRYYLYYALDFTNVISVAVADSPAGPFEFLEYVRTAQGEVPGVGNWFDPAILCEEDGNYLYYGFAPATHFPGQEAKTVPGAMMVRLADDMHTIISDPVCVANGVETASGTDYAEHPFFEGSSIRKLGGLYYFVYYSLQGHELCYGVAETPEGPFRYRGVIVSNGDLGYRGNELAVNYTGNNHGGLVEVEDKTYIFWHRHTHGTAFSRQGCAEQVTLLPDGSIPQVEITSCGLNGGPLPAARQYQSYIACHLTEEDRTQVGDAVMSGPGQPLPSIPAQRPYITEEPDAQCAEGYKPFIHNMRQGAVAGFKYFLFTGRETVALAQLRGKGSVQLRWACPEGEVAAEWNVDSAAWTWCAVPLHAEAGTYALYVVTTTGCVDFAAFEIQEGAK